MVCRANFVALNREVQLSSVVTPVTPATVFATAVARVHELNAACRKAVKQELDLPKNQTRTNGKRIQRPARTEDETPIRLATDKQIKAIQTIASRQGIQLNRTIYDRFGVLQLSALSISEASSLIDELKSRLVST